MQCIQRAISIYPTSWECRVPQDRRTCFKSDHSTFSAQITDQSLISHINTTTLSSKQVRRINNHQLSDTILIYQQILRTDTKRTVWITVMKLTLWTWNWKSCTLTLNYLHCVFSLTLVYGGSFLYPAFLTPFEDRSLPDDKSKANIAWMQDKLIEMEIYWQCQFKKTIWDQLFMYLSNIKKIKITWLY